MDFLGIGSLEMLLIVVIALLVLGPQRLQGVSRGLGRGLRELRKLGSEVSQALNEEETPSQGAKSGRGITQELGQGLQELKKIGSEVNQELRKIGSEANQAMTEEKPPTSEPHPKDEDQSQDTR
ncbi:MAG: twin-arginine translocase TatA/TatE family subunit [Chloroflexota bacterium]